MSIYSFDYDDWKTGWWELGEDPNSPVIAYREKFEDVFASIVKQLYSKERLDIGRLEDDIQWMADELNVTTPDHLPTIERRRTELFNFAAELAKLQQLAI